MTLAVTVGLGITRYRWRRLSRLLERLSEFNPDISLEQAVEDPRGHLSYTFLINGKELPELRKMLNRKGRFKIVEIKNLDTNQTVELSR